MANSQDRVVANAHRNLGSWVAFLALAIATAAAVFGILSKVESGETSDTLKAAGPPCVDVNGARPGVFPSKGCRAIYRQLVELCARNPGFCQRSQRQAVRRAQERSVQRAIGPTASLPGGGGESKGKSDPNSPSQPSPRSPGDGGGQGDEPNEPNTPNPSPTTPEQPTETVPPTEEPSGDPIVDVPKILDDVIDTVCQIASPLGPLVTTCP